MQALKFSLEVGINSDVLQGDSEMIIHALVDDNDFMKNLNPFGHLIKDAKFLVGDSRSIGFLQVCCCRELIRNFQSVRKKKKKRKYTPPKKKKNHMHKTIFTWFGNLPMFMELQGFHYY